VKEDPGRIVAGRLARGERGPLVFEEKIPFCRMVPGSNGA
jgi:hypothetical protein